MEDFLVEEKSNMSTSVTSLAETNGNVHQHNNNTGYGGARLELTIKTEKNHSGTNLNACHVEGMSGFSERKSDQPFHSEEELQDFGSLSTLPNQLVRTGKKSYVCGGVGRISLRKII
ncbi:hypothetical protein GOODEAATRI_002182 [Goodea atripinnis]|uniref:Uncharacterized protein n=1 Tax=Goodea atripinnis TaxID=208336 RepID=A0ABV0PAW9_9TELE